MRPVYAKQQAFGIEINGVRRYGRVEEGLSGVFVICWVQGMPHTNETCSSTGDYVHLPIVDYESATRMHNMAVNWETDSCVMVRIPMTASDRIMMEKALTDTIKPMNGKMGPCKQNGLMTGAGLPHSPLANVLRQFDGVRQVMSDVLRLDGRYVEDADYVTTRQALLLNEPDSCLPWHSDNDVIDHPSKSPQPCPEISRVQNQIFVRPPLGPPGKYLRTGVLASEVPLTPTVVRNLLKVFCTRGSMGGCGKIGKQTLDRPRPKKVLGGKYVKLARTQKMSTEEMITFCKAHVHGSVYADIDWANMTCELKGWPEFVKMCEAIVGPVIRTREVFDKRMAIETSRGVVVAALLGNFPRAELLKTRLCSNVKLCVKVYEEASKTMDPGIVRSFVDRVAGRKRKMVGAD